MYTSTELNSVQHANQQRSNKYILYIPTIIPYKSIIKCCWRVALRWINYMVCMDSCIYIYMYIYRLALVLLWCVTSMRFDVGKGVREDYAEEDEVLMVVLIVLRFFSCQYLARLPDYMKHFVRVDEMIGRCGDCVSREKKCAVYKRSPHR